MDLVWAHRRRSRARQVPRSIQRLEEERHWLMLSPITWLIMSPIVSPSITTGAEDACRILFSCLIAPSKGWEILWRSYLRWSGASKCRYDRTRKYLAARADPGR